MKDPKNGESRQFAFVTLLAPGRDAAEACERVVVGTDRAEVDGKRIFVERAKRDRPHDPTPGRYMGTQKRPLPLGRYGAPGGGRGAAPPPPGPYYMPPPGYYAYPPPPPPSQAGAPAYYYTHPPAAAPPYYPPPPQSQIGNPAFYPPQSTGIRDYRVPDDYSPK